MPPALSDAEAQQASLQMRALAEALGAVVIGQPAAIRELCIGLFADGHVLLEGVPGVGKTLLARTLAASLDLRFARVQFTPDLMPTDLLGAASRSSSQIAKDQSMATQGGTIVGKNAPANLQGQTIQIPTEVRN